LGGYLGCPSLLCSRVEQRVLRGVSLGYRSRVWFPPAWLGHFEPRHGLLRGYGTRVDGFGWFFQKCAFAQFFELNG
jgi:hypothetical protein